MSTTASRRAGFWRIRVRPRSQAYDALGAAALHDIRELGLTHVQRVAFSRLYLVQGNLPGSAIRKLCERLLADPITEQLEQQSGGDDPDLPGEGFDAAIEVHLKGGVMDPVAGSALKAMADMGLPTSGVAISTGRLYQLQGVRDLDEAGTIARRLFSNDCIEQVYLSGFKRHDPRPDHLPAAPQMPFTLRHVPICTLDDAALGRLSREAHLFLSLAEMRTIQACYRKLKREPTDLELEMLAQTWSEHCVHKTLKSEVSYQGDPMPDGAGGSVSGERRYGNLLRDTIARATYELVRTGRVDWCLSVFEDNAGVIAFDDEHGVAFKVETHNHPSAIEPYGGAATGVGGCIRDVMGCGLGAKPIANTDVFCFATPDFPMELMPKGVLHPRRVFKGVVGGVRDYGNRMGIPTINGAIHFDDRYLGNPLVFCGCVGLIPRDRIRKEPRPGDLIVVVGGRTGRDGIHGATFSSAELTDTHADEFSHAVQIGDAITEKKVLDAMLQARDHAFGCLYTAVTDCGAGGLSSAVGEMACRLGADVELERVPLKYAGLRYDEIWISEAQERMVLAVPPMNWDALQAICAAEDVEATVIGSFRDDGRLIVRYDRQTVGELDVRFLHEGLEKLHKTATWTQPARPGPRQRSRSAGSKTADELLRRLSTLGNASKEWVIRQYDHEVQGGSVIKPLTGPGQGPSDGAVIRPRLDSPRGVALAVGMAPELADVDPYWMAVAGIDEAIRNLVCVGGDPHRTALLDNFCWGNCADPQVMGALVRACQGCHDAALAFGTPFISGKDSLNNEFALDAGDADRLAHRIPLHNQRIRIPHTLLISAISVIEDVRHCVSMDAKPQPTSTFWSVRLAADDWSEVKLPDAAALHAAVAGLVRAGLILAAHDVGPDGVLPPLAEMALAGLVGIDARLEGLDPFAPITSGYILQVADTDAAGVRDTLAGLSGVAVEPLGRPRRDALFNIQTKAGKHAELPLTALAAAWRDPLAW